MTDLMNWFEALQPSLQIFWGVSILSSIIFAFQFLMTLIGFDTDTDVDISDADLSAEFSIFSLRSIIAFLMFFGWTGVFVMQGGGSATKAIILGTIAGTTAMSIVAYLLYKIHGAEESGTVDLYSAVGKEGEVYIPIPPNLNGKGKIHVEIDNKLMELVAVTKNNKLSTGSKVKVLDILEKNVLLVESL